MLRLKDGTYRGKMTELQPQLMAHFASEEKRGEGESCTGGPLCPALRSSSRPPESIVVEAW